MTLRLLSLLAFSLVLTGCSPTATETEPAGTTPETPEAGTTPVAPEAATPTATEPEAATDDGIAITPETTVIQFVGNHAGDKPDPRTCTFTEFSGSAVVDTSLVSFEVEIKTASLSAEMDNLTAHLKNADFFDVNQYPTATFKSTKISAGEDDSVTIDGQLTLLGQTHPVSFPATVSTTDGLKLSAAFEIDRTTWGMNYDTGKVEKMVEMTITIGG